MESLGFLFQPIEKQKIFSREDFSEEEREIFEMVSNFAKEAILPKRKELSKLDKELTFDILQKQKFQRNMMDWVCQRQPLHLL